MANILGSLQVELSANTAKFVDDLGKAAYAARQTAKEIDKSFSSLGRIASQTFGPFGQLNPIISQLSFIIAQTGRSAATAMSSIGPMNSAIGATAALGAGAVAAMTAISLGAAAMAVKTAEAAAKMYEQSQAAGVSVEALSGLSFAAKQSGVDQELLIKALERMSASAFKAATAPVGTINAYTRLGLSAQFVRDHLNDTVGLFTAVSDKIAALGNTATRTAVLAEIFGIRFGPQLAAMMAKGGAAIKDQIDLQRALGAELDEKTAVAAQKFKEELGKLELASRGFQLALMRELLPALQTIVKALESLSEGGHASAIHQIALGFGAIAIAAAGAAAGVKETLILLEDMKAKLSSAFAPSLSRALLPPILGAVVAPNEELARQEEERANRIKATHEEFLKFAEDIKKGLNPELHVGVQFDESKAAKVTKWLENVSPEKFSKIEAEAKKLGITMEALAARMMMPGGGIDLSPKPGPKKTADDAFITRAIAKLREQTEAELALAAATGQTMAAQHMQQAENEANILVSRLLAEADTKDITIRARLRAEIEKLIPAIHALTAEEKAAKDAITLNAELDKQTRAFNVQIASLEQLAAAYAVGGAAIASAEISKKVEAEREKVDELAQEYELAASQAGVTEAALAKIKAALDAANASLGVHEIQARTEAAKNFSVEIAKETNLFRAELPALQLLNVAYLENADAVREAQVQLKVAQAIEAERQKGHELTATEILRLTDLERDKGRIAHETAIAQEAAQLEVQEAYDRTITKLRDVRNFLASQGKSTLFVDVAIDQERIGQIEKVQRAVFDFQNAELLGNARLYDSQRSLLEQWDQAALKVGTLTDKFHAFFNEITLAGKSAGEQIFGAMHKAFDDLSTQLAKLVVTGKADFKQLFESLAEEIIKAGLQKGFADLVAKITGGLGGIFGAGKVGTAVAGITGKGAETAQLAALGTAATTATTALGLLSAGFTSTTVELATLTPEFTTTTLSLTELTAAANSAALALSTIAASGGGGGGSEGGGFLGFLSSLFPGGGAGAESGLGSGMERGGDVIPGKAYVVGEKRPELFIPKVAGRIIPSVPAGMAALAKMEQAAGQSEARERPLAVSPFTVNPLRVKPSGANPFTATPAAAAIAALLLTAPATGLAAAPSAPASAPPTALSSILRSTSSASTLIKILESHARAAGGGVASGATYLVGEDRPEIFLPVRGEAAQGEPGAAGMPGEAGAPGASSSKLSSVVRSSASSSLISSSKFNSIIKELTSTSSRSSSSAALSNILRSSSASSSLTKMLQRDGFTLNRLTVKGRAAGGPVAPGETYLVGENRPEMFLSGAAGTPGASGKDAHIWPYMATKAAQTARAAPPSVSASIFTSTEKALSNLSRGEFSSITKALTSSVSRSSSSTALSSVLRSSAVSSFTRILEREGRAAGGPVSAGATYLVGEDRPEIFLPGPAGMPGAAGAPGATSSNSRSVFSSTENALSNLSKVRESLSQTSDIRSSRFASIAKELSSISSLSSSSSRSSSSTALQSVLRSSRPEASGFGTASSLIKILESHARAAGGGVAPGATYLVGEDRPEIFMPSPAGTPGAAGAPGPRSPIGASSSVLTSIFASTEKALSSRIPKPRDGSSRSSFTSIARELTSASSRSSSSTALSSVLRSISSSSRSSSSSATLSNILRSSAASSLIKILESQGRAAGGEVTRGGTYMVGEDRPEIFMPGSPMPPAAAAMAKMGQLGLNFGGFREMGGSVMPGSAYVVGEGGKPEFFIPDQPGHISPSRSFGTAQQPHQTVIHFHINGVTDADSFRKSQPQIMAEFYRAAAIAHARNR